MVTWICLLNSWKQTKDQYITWWNLVKMNPKEHGSKFWHKMVSCNRNQNILIPFSWHCHPLSISPGLIHFITNLCYTVPPKRNPAVMVTKFNEAFLGCVPVPEPHLKIIVLSNRGWNQMRKRWHCTMVTGHASSSQCSMLQVVWQFLRIRKMQLQSGILS